ncbi:hypothetical protein BpHYR1_003390 [Brachionus plicatilis]|uniref:Uncharacterized protein n=1 Tax=Brachionus plicatilis TaxID=10195 RepID=A0A3M7SYB0_BRAPC|nr:hypothetical protein BpHYR1_003390 [Brachionus plicatilis]
MKSPILICKVIKELTYALLYLKKNRNAKSKSSETLKVKNEYFSLSAEKKAARFLYDPLSL